MKDEKQSSLTEEYLLDDDFDPLEEDDVSEEDDDEEIIGYVGTQEDAVTVQEKVDTRPAIERIDELLRTMAPRRKVLLGTIAFCREPQSVSAVNAYIDEMQEYNYSVFTAANLCTLLEKAGALVRITEDGKVADDVEATPKTVIIDGVEYLEAQDPVEIQWLSTEDGIEALEADKPLERLNELFAEDELYLTIYERILRLCAASDGATVAVINEAVDNDPLVQKPRLYAPHFIDKLEKCDALTWRKAWQITDIGQTGLELLSQIEDNATEASAHNTVATATKEA